MELEYIEPPTGVKGCFLVFDVANEGTLFQVWGENVSGNVMAFFSPGKPVPGYKYSGGASSRVEIIRKFRGDKARFYQGITQFVKLAKDFQGECVFLCPSVSVYLRSEANGDIVQLIPGAPALPIMGYTATVALPSASTSVSAGTAVMQEQLLRIGVSEGWGLAL